MRGAGSVLLRAELLAQLTRLEKGGRGSSFQTTVLWEGSKWTCNLIEVAGVAPRAVRMKNSFQKRVRGSRQLLSSSEGLCTQS